ncbi:hypothetical protein [Prosthecobacter sp.]|uniref:hypothetical protein n=1 Tax=Prosthecobacter sp. TaxID=1965333 RepID=UPI0037848245
MKIAKFREIVEANSLDELHEHLQARHDSFFGSFWFWHDDGPELSVMVNREDAYLLFISPDGASHHSTLDLMTNPHVPRTYIGGAGPSLYSSYSKTAEFPDKEIEFLADNHEPTPMSKLYTVPLSQAITAIDHFFVSGQRSENIQWLLLEPPPPPSPPSKKAWWRLW